MTPRDPVYYGALVQDSKSNEWTKKEIDIKSADKSSAVYSAYLRPELIRSYALYREQRAHLAARAEKLKKAAAERKRKSEEAEAADAAGTKEGEEMQTSEAEQEEKTAHSSETVSVPPLRLNLNVWTKFAANMDQEQVQKDEDEVVDVSKYLLNLVLPGLLRDMQKGALTPLDGDALTAILHSRGVNVRYLSHLAEKTVALERESRAAPWLLEVRE